MTIQVVVRRTVQSIVNFVITGRFAKIWDRIARPFQIVDPNAVASVLPRIVLQVDPTQLVDAFGCELMNDLRPIRLAVKVINLFVGIEFRMIPVVESARIFA